MENIYDLAYNLARALKESEEYKTYHAARDKAMENPTQKALLDEYKHLQFQMQVAMAGGSSADPKEMERLSRIAAVLQLSPEAQTYLLSELRFQQMLSEVFKILGEAADLDLDALAGRS